MIDDELIRPRETYKPVQTLPKKLPTLPTTPVNIPKPLPKTVIPVVNVPKTIPVPPVKYVAPVKPVPVAPVTSNLNFQSAKTVPAKKASPMSKSSRG